MNTTTTLVRRDWLELPTDITAKILLKLSVIDLIVSAQVVCLSWWRICKEPSMWRRIDMSALICKDDLKKWRRIDMTDSIWRNSSMWWHIDKAGLMCSDSEYLRKMFCYAIDRSQGQLIDLNVGFVRFAELFYYMAERSSGLKRLRLGSSVCILDEILIRGIAKLPLQLEELELPNHEFSINALKAIGKSSCLKRLRLASWEYTSNKALIEVVAKLPLLEELELANRQPSMKALETIGKSCPLLDCFKLNTSKKRCSIDACDKQAIAIAENMHELRHLELVGNKLSRNGLQAILNGCPQLEFLDIRQCFNLPGPVYLRKTLHKVKSVKFTGSL
ncbi:hypothetical protein ACFE04_030977 [Oxalis oulophora]